MNGTTAQVSTGRQTPGNHPNGHLMFHTYALHKGLECPWNHQMGSAGCHCKPRTRTHRHVEPCCWAWRTESELIVDFALCRSNDSNSPCRRANCVASHFCIREFRDLLRACSWLGLRNQIPVSQHTHLLGCWSPKTHVRQDLAVEVGRAQSRLVRAQRERFWRCLSSPECGARLAHAMNAL